MMISLQERGSYEFTEAIFQGVKRLCILERVSLPCLPKSGGKGSLVAFFSYQCLLNAHSISQLWLLLYLRVSSQLRNVQLFRMPEQCRIVYLHSLVHPSFDQRV